MLDNFLYIYKSIKVVINSSKSKAFKDKSLILTDIEINYYIILIIFRLKNTLVFYLLYIKKLFTYI